MICRAKCRFCGNQVETKGGSFDLKNCLCCGHKSWNCVVGNGAVYPDGWVISEQSSLIKRLIDGIKKAVGGQPNE